MNKYIEKVETYKHKILDKTLENLKAEYKEAEDFYQDTGYDRYFNKMSKCEEQINEIERYLHPITQKDISTEQYREFLDLKRTMQSIKSNLIYIMAYLPDCTEKTRLNDLLREIRDYEAN